MYPPKELYIAVPVSFSSPMVAAAALIRCSCMCPSLLSPSLARPSPPPFSDGAAHPQAFPERNANPISPSGFSLTPGAALHRSSPVAGPSTTTTTLGETEVVRPSAATAAPVAKVTKLPEAARLTYPAAGERG